MDGLFKRYDFMWHHVLLEISIRMNMYVASIGFRMSLVTALIISTTLLTLTADAARILAIFPFPAHSHQEVNHQLSMGLAKRGHELTVFTTNPMNKNIPNYTEHSLSHFYPLVRTRFNYMEAAKQGILHHFMTLIELIQTMTDDILSNTHIKAYISPNSTTKFDLLIIASHYHDSLHYLSVLLNTPLILIVSSSGYAVHHFQIGNPTFPAYVPDLTSGYSDKMTFWQRLHNLSYIIRQWYGYYYISAGLQEAVLRKHFGDNAPPIEDLNRRISMMFITTHPLLHYSRPIAPNIVQIGGFRMGMINKTMPEELKNILDDAKQGFIYFSLGSNINSSELRAETLEIIIGAFSELPYLILWKFDAISLPHQPENVLIQKWIPQHGVLAHPNIKLFIYQGGMQSGEEAIECGVPLLGIPIFLDQYFNVEALKQKGIAESLNLYTMTKDEIKDTVHKIIANSEYKENIRKLWTVFSDRPRHPLDEALWWSEYVIRHKSAPYLQSPRLPWYKYHLIDVYVFFVVVFLLLSYLLWKLLQLSIIPALIYRSKFKKVSRSTLKREKVKRF